MGRLAIVALLLSACAAAAEAPDPALLEIKRVFVDPLVGSKESEHMRDVLITALQNTKLFKVTDMPDNADTVVRGSATYDSFDDTFEADNSISVRSYAGTGGTSSKTASKVVKKAPIDMSASENDNTHIEEHKHEAMMSVRFVNKEGDVIWSTTKESGGAKFRGAAADVADKIAKQLIADFDRAKKQAK